MPDAEKFPRRPGARRSVALIAVLAILAFLTVIVVGLTLSMRMEGEAAHSYEANATAGLLAGEGIACVKGALKTAAEAGGGVWASAPGQIVLTTNGVATVIPLSSGTAVNTNSGAGVYKACDLNRVSVSQDQLRAVTGTAGAGDAMYAGWIYVRQSGLCDTNQAPVIDAADPIIGRFAYWADDESSRIDLNTAWGGTGNTNSANHPSRVGLTNLFGASLAGTVYGAATNSAFASPDDARRLGPALAAAISTNRFALTHAALAANLNPWGQPKIVLTTQASRTNGTGSTNYLNILATPNTDPGNYAALSQANLTATVSNLTALLRTNWPGFNRSFSQKYELSNSPAASPYRAVQIALDIVDYVRAAESTNAIVEPLRGMLTNGNQYLYVPGSSLTNVFFGATRHPVLTQIALTVSTDTDPSVPGHRGRVAMTLYLPPGYAGTSMDTNAMTMGVSGLDTSPMYRLWPNPPDIPTTNTFAQSLRIPQADIALIGTYPLTPGASCVITVDFVYAGSMSGAPTAQFRSYFNAMDGAVWEISCINSHDAVQVPVNFVAGLPVMTVGQSLRLSEPLDPRVKASDGWTNVTDKLGQVPAVWTNPVSVSPPQDTEANGSVAISSGLYLPPPRGQPGNLAGMVGSVAELGHVSTGGSSNTVPWRTIRLQPTSGTGATPPDWALLDLFQAPTSATNNAALYQPLPGAASGRINLNAGLLTNGVALGTGPGVARTASLAALFEGATNMTAAARANAVTNAAAMKLATGGTNYGFPCYVSPGEIAEVAGVADGGEASEANLYGLVDLAATQGAAFRVYCVGQALKQTSLGQLILQAEQYKEAVVRGYNPAWTNQPSMLLWKNIPQ